MGRADGCPKLWNMTTTIVAVEVRLVDDGIEGFITCSDGQLPFAGYLELIQALESRRSDKFGDVVEVNR